MQMSRSVIMPTTRPPPPTTGSVPQSCSHMSIAAAAKSVSGEQDRTPLVITSSTFISVHLSIYNVVGSDAGRSPDDVIDAGSRRPPPDHRPASLFALVRAALALRRAADDALLFSQVDQLRAA